jgi:hypothetical protein
MGLPVIEIFCHSMSSKRVNVGLNVGGIRAGGKTWNQCAVRTVQIHLGPYIPLSKSALESRSSANLLPNHTYCNKPMRSYVRVSVEL